MKRFYIDALNKSTFGATYYDACAKPHSDAEKIANVLGFESIYLYGSRLSKLGKPIWKKILLHAYNLSYQAYVLWQARKLNSIHNADIFIQYGFSTEAMFSIVNKLKKNGNRIILLVHDVESFRFKSVWKSEQNLFSNTDIVIVHTVPMAERLKELGYKGKVEVLEFFDYLNDYKTVSPTADIRKQIDIVFAGNLDKSMFIRKLNTLKAHPDFHFFLYGKYTGELITNDFVQYKGFFQNDDIAAIEGTWGLVWDGEETTSCAGNFGEYLKINAPFKLSLYLAKGLPVIVWEESAMAHYVKKYNLGITVNSLDDIYDTIHNLTPEQITLIEEGVRVFSQNVKSGKMLSAALNKVL